MDIITELIFIVLLCCAAEVHSLSCYECLHLEMFSDSEYVNLFLGSGKLIDDENCKLSGEEFNSQKSTTKVKDCHWMSNDLLYGEDWEDFYDYNNYIGKDYYNNLFHQQNEIVCQKEYAYGTMDVFGIEISMEVWGRGCQALDTLHGKPPDGCTNDVQYYEKGLLYILQGEFSSFADITGEVCFCHSDKCNSATTVQTGFAAMMVAAVFRLIL